MKKIYNVHRITKENTDYGIDTIDDVVRNACKEFDYMVGWKLSKVKKEANKKGWFLV